MDLEGWTDEEVLVSNGYDLDGLKTLSANSLTFITETLASVKSNAAKVLKVCADKSLAEGELHTKYSDDDIEKLLSLMAKTANHLIIVKTITDSVTEMDVMASRDACVRTIRFLKSIEDRINDLNGTTYSPAVASGSALALGAEYEEDTNLPGMFKTKGNHAYTGSL